MTRTVWPLQTFLFQAVFLLVAIALEARVFNRMLKISRKNSVEYAISINLLATVVGWLTFFILMNQKNLLPQQFKEQIISYIFFDRPLSTPLENLNLIIAATGIIIFFAAFIIKLKGLQLLEALLQRFPQQRPSAAPERRHRLALSDRLEHAVSHTNPKQAMVVLLANAYSHSAILLLLLLRFLSIRTLS